MNEKKTDFFFKHTKNAMKTQMLATGMHATYRHQIRCENTSVFSSIAALTDTYLFNIG